jgi:hypothetical protein
MYKKLDVYYNKAMKILNTIVRKILVNVNKNM